MLLDNMWNTYSPQESEIVWITDLEQLKGVYDFDLGFKPFIFARYSVVDHTCDKTLKKKFLSMNRAEERKQKQLATKKHAKCSIEIVENKIIDALDLDLSNVLGTDANMRRWETNFYNYSENRPTLEKLITIKDNISMTLKVTEVELDKNIITKNDKPMRLTKLGLQDKNGNGTVLIMFDSDIVDKIKIGDSLKLVDAQVNMRMYSDSNESRPDGLKIPPWGSVSILSESENNE
jgi:hypothetical protein